MDVACGTGNCTSAIALARNVQMYGIDSSRRMIEAAKRKSDLVLWEVGDVEFLPFTDRSFSGVFCTLGIHHFERLQSAVDETFRVLDHGNFVIFTATPAQMRRYWLNEYFPVAMTRSMEQMPELQTVIESMESAGFRVIYTEKFEVEEELQDLFLYGGKTRPEIYLNPAVRNGISTFADLAGPEEVRQGCRRLAADIESGHIKEVISAYQHEEGDYLFVVAEM